MWRYIAKRLLMLIPVLLAVAFVIYAIMNVAEGYNQLVADCGQDTADELVSAAAYKYIVLMMRLKMFEQPYNDSAYADSIIFSDSAMEYGKETQAQSVVMI